MTLSEIARRIEEIRKGTLPPSLYHACDDSLSFVDHRGIRCGLNDDIARHMLIGAMVMAMDVRRQGKSWILKYPTVRIFRDPDHGNDPLRSLLAVFERVYAKEDK